MNGRRGRWLPVAVWVALIFFLSSRPDLPLPGVDWLDELIGVAGHFFEYAVLGFLAARAMSRDAGLSRARLAVALLWCSVYALSDEWHQRFVPGRDASVLDWTVDVIGAVAGSIVYRRRMRDEETSPRRRSR